MKSTNVLAILALAGTTSMALAQECSSKSACSESKPAVTAASHVMADDIVDTAVKAGKFNTLAAALKAAGLVDTLKGAGPFTVFAPTDEAFAKLPKGTLDELLKPENKAKLTAILTYHVVPGSVLAADVTKLSNAATVNGQRVDIKAAGGKVMIDGATVTATDVKTSNGVIHVIDTVIMPSTDDVVDTAVKAGSFKTLAAALKAAGLVDALKGSGPFTVFAPTDEAFAKLPKGTLDDLLKPENKEKLVSILKYHVVSGRVFSNDAVAAKHAKTLQGGEVKITSDGGVKIDNATVVSADLDASNGVIHVIDTVIMPKSK
ncbi:MAG: fasciclin domain-containing protein [Phycisphaerales bacterium]|nr:fasciclin domain-containing protein [Phycisphaerales bacterium]